ncbi:MAG: DUF5787 family protein [Haloarculaceae archaeon]
MREAAFELALCAALESPGRVVSRQLGAHVHGRRIVDTVVLEPGPDFDDRAAITSETIPPAAVAADVGPGSATPIAEAFECHPERAREVAERAVEVGFFERERRGGRTCVRQTARYPDEWVGRVVGVENKPDLGRPGDLETQLQTDVSLGLLDEVVLATASYVTGAHLNRIPDAVGIWRFDPETGHREVVREPTPLSPTEPGVELLDRRPGRADVRVATAAEKAAARGRLAERAYGKGWRPSSLPACARCTGTQAGVPECEWKGRPVAPAVECGPDCSGHDPAPPPAVPASARLRDERSAWVREAAGRRRRQAGLDRFG